jgi:hypothetical protein
LKFELQVTRIMENNEWKKWYSRYWRMRRDLIEKKIRNFKLVVHETWRRTSYPVVFKMYKKQIWSENYETCRDVMISYGKAVVKIWWGFVKVTTYDAYKLKVLQRNVWFYVKPDQVLSWYQTFTKSYTNFITVSSHDNMTSRQVS